MNIGEVFDLNFASGSKEQILEAVWKLSQQPEGHSVLFANAHVVVEANRKSPYKQLLKQASVIVPDGVPVAWTMKALGHYEATRYSGPDFMEDLFARYPQSKHFFLGSTPETLEKIKERFKGIATGFYSPPFAPEFFDQQELQKQEELLRNADADFVWVGLGAPKQERYVVEMSQRLNKGVFLAVGAAFDFFAGNKPRAPEALQKVGMEWAFRLASEPRRLAGRYFSTNPQFVAMALSEIATRRLL